VIYFRRFERFCQHLRLLKACRWVPRDSDMTLLVRPLILLSYITMMDVINARHWPLGPLLMNTAATERSQFIEIRSRFATPTFDLSFYSKFEQSPAQLAEKTS